MAEDDTCSEVQIIKIRTKLHNLLLILATGEANTVVERCRGRHGLLAWKRLCTTLNPRTLASGVKAVSNVVNPSRITDPKKADLAIEIWEGLSGKLDSEYGKTLSSKMQMAVLYAMLPKDLQEKVLDKCAVSWDKAKEQEAALIFSRVKEEVKNVAKSRRDMIIPKPMDVDTIKMDHWTDEYTYGHDENHDTEEDDNVCFVGRDEEQEKGKELVSRAECSAIGRQGFPTKVQVKERKADGMVAAILVVGAQATFSEIVRPKTANMCEMLFIGHTEAITCEGDGHEHEQKVGTRRERKVPCKPPPGLGARSLDMTHRQKNSFRALMVEQDDNEEIHDIQTVTKDESWADLGMGDMTVDSAADESCWPHGQGDAFVTSPSKKRIPLRTANGSDMNHHGEKDITFKCGSDIIGLKFQVTGVRKPRLAARRLVEEGNIVPFGPEPENNFIMNVESGKKIMINTRVVILSLR